MIYVHLYYKLHINITSIYILIICMLCLLTRLYKERIKEVNDKLVEVKLGTAKEYREPLKRLKEQLDTRLEVAAELKKLKLVNLEHKFQSQAQSIKQHYKVIEIINE